MHTHKEFGMKHGIIILIMLLLISLLSAPQDRHFTIGTYSYWQARDSNRKYSPATDSLLKYLQLNHYNSMIIDTYNNDAGLKNLTDKMLASGIEPIITDFNWVNLKSRDVFPVRGMTLSNYMKFEAEYADVAEVNPGDDLDDRYNYLSQTFEKDRTPRSGAVSSISSNHSNQRYWLCEPQKHKAGFAFEDIHYRWLHEEGRRVGLGNEFQFIKSPWDVEIEHNYLTENNLNFVFAIRISGYQEADPTLTDNQLPVLLRFVLEAVNADGKRITLPHRLHGSIDAQSETIITARTLSGISDLDEFANRLLKFTISLKELKDSALFIEHESARYQLRDIYPRLHWNANSRLELDYMEIYDDLNFRLRNEPELFRENLNRRLKNLKAICNGNLRYVYAFDEPNQGQFNSYKNVEAALDVSGPKIFSAIYNWKRYCHKPDKSEYNHPYNFIRQVQARIISPDIYPLDRWLPWKTASFQKQLDIKLCNNYKLYRDFCEESTASGKKMEFMPVVQSFGFWYEKTGQWGWMLPPAETQKLLQYMPLCYGAIGIMNFVFPWWIGKTPLDAQLYGALMINSKEDVYGYEFSPNYKALQEANRKIAVYGGLIKNLNWHNALTIMTSKDKLAEVKPCGFKKMYVPIRKGDPEPQGYIQCGFYSSSEGFPAIFILNRRANIAKTSNPGSVRLADYEKSFSPALEQELRFKFEKSAIPQTDSPVILYDPVDPLSNMVYLVNGKPLASGQDPNTSNLRVIAAIDADLAINLPPGDGFLLMTAKSLPQELDSSITIQDQRTIGQMLVLRKNSILTISPQALLELLPQTIISINSNATLDLQGDIINTNCLIIVEGKLKLSKGTYEQLKPYIYLIHGGELILHKS